MVRTTNVKSRFVTAAAGGLLILIAIFAPLVRLATCLPGSVVCGTAVIVFSIIGVIGIDMIAREPLHTRVKPTRWRWAGHGNATYTGTRPVSEFPGGRTDGLWQRHGSGDVDGDSGELVV